MKWRLICRTRLPIELPLPTSHYQGSDFHISAKIWELATLRHPNFLTPHGKSQKLHRLVVTKFKDYIYWNLNGVKSVEKLLILHRKNKNQMKPWDRNVSNRVPVAEAFCFRYKFVLNQCLIYDVDELRPFKSICYPDSMKKLNTLPIAR